VKQLQNLEKRLPYILIICGLIGLTAAFIILYDKLQLLADPSYNPPCSINPVISCGSIMKSEQSHLFGFPNPIIGLAAFPVLITTGVAMLAGARFKRWYWRGLQIGAALGVVFITWLFFESVYRIQALCPYCMVVWTVVILTFLYVSLYNLRKGYVRLPAKISLFMQRHHLDILISWYLLLFVLILHHFWYFFGPK
jgi:uncharacterized membrane protein